MRHFLLDSTLLAAYLSGRKKAVKLIQPWLKKQEVSVSILSYGEVVEQLKGRSNFVERQKQLRDLLREIYPYFLTYPILERYADIRRKLRPPHGSGLIGDIDTLIAATAIERKLILVTTDTDFDRNIAGLKLKLISRKSLDT